MEKFLIWFEDGSTAKLENMNYSEVVDYCKSYLTETHTTITVEMYSNGKYIGETDYSFNEFCEYYEN